MNRSTRTIAMAIVLIAILLAVAVPAAAKQPDRTDYEARTYVCALGPSAREWYTDDGTVWHFRNMRYQTPIFSDEPRIAGVAYWQGNQDQNFVTGEGRAWGTGTIVTELGIWHTVYEGTYSATAVSSKTKGHGVNGLQGQSLYWEGAPLAPPYPDASPCEGANPIMALQLTGYILDRKGD